MVCTQLRRGLILFNMKKEEKTLAIFFVEGSGLVVYSAKQPQGTSFPFPSGSVEHMEIINHDLIRDMIAQACATLELADTQGLIVFGKSLTFEKQITPLPEEKLQEQTESFKDSTPFERVASHVYKNAQGSLIVSMNRDFYDTLRQILERGGVHVVGVIPLFVLQTLIGNGAITLKSLKTLSSKLDELSSQSIIVHKAAPKTLQEKQEYISKKYSGLVVAVFVIFLLAVFGGTWYVLQSQFKASRKPSPTPVINSVTTSEQVLEVVPTEPPVVIATSSALQITIVHVPQVASQAASLKKSLQTASFSQVKTQAQSGLQGNQPLVVFKPSVPQLYRTQILDRIKEIFPNVSVQELAELPSDVSITLGK